MNPHAMIGACRDTRQDVLTGAGPIRLRGVDVTAPGPYLALGTVVRERARTDGTIKRAWRHQDRRPRWEEHRSILVSTFQTGA